MSDLTITHAGSTITRSADSPGSSISTSRRKIIRVTPTLSTDAYALGDVLFTATEIENAVLEDGGSSKLIGMYILDFADVADSDAYFIFTEGSTALGTINDTAGITDADLKANNVCGFLNLDASAATMGAVVDNARMYSVLPASGASEQSNANIILQAAEGSTSVYVQSILYSSTTPTYAADSWQLIFHIEY